MTIDASAFNFDAMKEAVGVDPFAKDTNTRYSRDERFYMLQKDKDGNGAALIRFLPDSERGMIQKLFKINTTIVKNGKKRFVSQFSPATIGQPCPFQEAWQDRWNAGDKEGAKQFGRGLRFVANIKILKDPANPENEGKIFMYEMSGAMKDKIQNAVDPSEQDRALGATPKELFNPLAGNSFRLVAKKGANGQINYDSSEVITEVSSIYETVEAALLDIKENTHKLSDLLLPESFMSYPDLQNKMKWVTFADTEQVAVTEPLKADVAAPSTVEAEVVPAEAVPVAESTEPVVEQKTETPAPVANTSLDDLLKGIV
jgi:hypothetical protein